MTIASTSSIVIATNSSSINNKEAMDVSASKDATSASETANSNNTRLLKVSSSPATSADAPQPSTKCSATIPSFCQSQHTPTTPTATMRDETTDEKHNGQGPSNSPQENAPSARVTNENAENTPTTRHQSFSGNHSLHRTTATAAAIAEPPTGAVATNIHKAVQNESPDDNTHQIDSETQFPSNAKVLSPSKATDAKEATKTISDTNQKEQIINHSGSVGDDGPEDNKVAWQLHDGGETDESQTATTEIQQKKKKQCNKPPSTQAGSDKWGVDYYIQKQLAIDLETDYPFAKGGIHTLLNQKGQPLAKFLDKKNLEHCGGDPRELERTGGIYRPRGSKLRCQISQLIQYWKGFDPEKYQQTIFKHFNRANTNTKNPDCGTVITNNPPLPPPPTATATTKTTVSYKSGVDYYIQKQLAIDLETDYPLAEGGIHTLLRQQGQPLAKFLDKKNLEHCGGDPNELEKTGGIYGPRGSKLRVQLSQLIQYWKGFDPEKYQQTILKDFTIDKIAGNPGGAAVVINNSPPPPPPPPPKTATSSHKSGVGFYIQKQLAIDLETEYPLAEGGINSLLHQPGVGQPLAKFLEKKNLEHCGGDQEMLERTGGIYGPRGSKLRTQISQLIQYWKGFDPEKYQKTVLKGFNLDKSNPPSSGAVTNNSAPTPGSPRTTMKANHKSISSVGTQRSHQSITSVGTQRSTLPTATQLDAPSTTNIRKPDQSDRWGNESPEDYQRRLRKNELSRLWHRIRNQCATEQEKRRYTEMTGKAQPTIRSYKSCTERVRQIVRQKELETQTEKFKNNNQQHRAENQQQAAQSRQQQQTQQQQLNHQLRMQSILQVASAARLAQWTHHCGPYSQITRAPNTVPTASPPIPWMFTPFLPSPPSQPFFPPTMPFNNGNRGWGQEFAPPAGIMPLESVPALHSYRAPADPRQWGNQLAGPDNPTPQGVAVRHEHLITNDKASANNERPGTDHRASQSSRSNQDKPAAFAATNNLTGGRQETLRKRKASELDGDRNVVSPEGIPSMALETAHAEDLPASQPNDTTCGKRHASKPQSNTDANGYENDAGATTQQTKGPLDGRSLHAPNITRGGDQKSDESSDDTEQEPEQQWMIPEEFVFTC